MYSTFTSVEKELRGRVSGDVWFDPDKRAEYSTAKCMYRVMPVGVVAPRNVGDVQETVRLCAENDIAIIPRGGGTGLAGQAIGFGVILDFTKHMNQFAVGTEESGSVTAQAGCILADMNILLRPLQKFYPIDPQSAKQCTVGGTVATNAAGAHGLRYGSTKNQIRGLTLVLSNGDRVEVNPIESKNHLTPGAATRFSEIKELLATNREAIRSHTPSVEKYSSGYNIFEALQEDNLDATRLICGSEGTLAVVTDATLSIHPLPHSTIAVLAYFESYDSTTEAIQIARRFSPAAIEMLDKSYTVMGKGISPISDGLIDLDFQTMLLIEFEGDEEIVDRANGMHAALEKAGILLDWVMLTSEAQRSAMWMLRETATERLNAIPSRERKISTIEDGAVPIANLPLYMRGLKRILDNHSISFTVYGHAGSGHIHCTTIGEVETPAGRNQIVRATEEVFDLIIKLGGTLSAEHGDGFVRTPFLERAFGTRMYGIFTDVKRILDPQNILNPQKIIGKQDGVFLHDLKIA